MGCHIFLLEVNVMKKRIIALILLIVSLSVFGCAKISNLPMDSSASGMQDPKPSAPSSSAGIPEKDETAIADKNDDGPSPEENKDEGQTGEEPGSEEDKDEGQISEKPVFKENKSEGQISEALSTANREFSWNLFKKLNAEDSSENIFISPYSISSALTMALNGAEGNTRVEMEKTLQYNGLNRDDLNIGYANEANRLSKLDKKVKLQNANSIWMRSSFEVKKEFIELNRRYMQAEVQSLDFKDSSSADAINGWVSEKTNKLITKIISPPIPDDVIMYLINAIYGHL